MKYFIYTFLIFQFAIILESYSGIKKTNNSREILKWEKIEKNYNNKLEGNLKWERIEKNFNNNFKSNPNWEIVPKEEILDQILMEKNNNNNIFNGVNNQNIYDLSPLIPSNNFIKKNGVQSKIEWKSSFGGGEAGGTGQQNNSFKLDYGLGNLTQLAFYFAEADDIFYNYINGKRGQFSWQTYALSLKQKIWNYQRFNSSISVLSSVEYFKVSSGSKQSKSIFNENDNSFDKDKFGQILYSISVPFAKKITNKFTYTFVPGFISFPEKLGERTNRNNFYGNNFYIGNGITLDLFEDLSFLGSLSYPLGPGKNYFDKNLNFGKKTIYSYGLNWNLNKKIAIETKITNGFGSTPATGILTIPSDNLPLYIANFKYIPDGKDTYLKPLEEKDKLMSFGGITVNNALLPSNGTSQYKFNFDSNGNYHTSYDYSLSNIFQLELINLSSINNKNKTLYLNENFTSAYLDENNFNIRLGGKLLLFSPQKNDILWTSFRTSVGRNESSNQGYIFSELINTYRINHWLAGNLSYKYFYSGTKRFGAIGASMYLNLAKNLQIIPEVNYLLDKKMMSNNTISIRYSFSENKSIDLYVSNAVNTQDLGQLLRSKDRKFGINLNLFY